MENQLNDLKAIKTILYILYLDEVIQDHAQKDSLILNKNSINSFS